ncbi:hypothetical protein [Parafrankia discariae]|uniref:hypothetical protein n=1 Tax=Parafrankia discariae TaxID=365528 RepID=UPI0012B69F26|nr:hypothetical protein [Parafrankia discariae]
MSVPRLDGPGIDQEGPSVVVPVPGTRGEPAADARRGEERRNGGGTLTAQLGTVTVTVPPQVVVGT